MRHVRIFLAIALTVFWSQPLIADPVSECWQGASDQVSVGACLSEVEQIVDLTIEANLGFAMDAAVELDGITERDVSAPALLAGQAAWTSYRDAHCEFVGTSFGGGTGTRPAIQGCRIELGRIRAGELFDQVR